SRERRRPRGPTKSTKTASPPSVISKEESMNITRRRLMAGGLAPPPPPPAGPRAVAPSPAPPQTSPHFPPPRGNEGDFRDRLCKRFAADVEKKTNGALKFEIYANSSLMKVNSQFSAMRKGALDLSLVPISYSGGEVPELNIGLLPALVPSYE